MDMLVVEKIAVAAGSVVVVVVCRGRAVAYNSATSLSTLFS